MGVSRGHRPAGERRHTVKVPPAPLRPTIGPPDSGEGSLEGGFNLRRARALVARHRPSV